MADIQDEVELIQRLSGQPRKAVSAKSIAETAELQRPSDADQPPVRNALVAIKPQRPARKRKPEQP